jgi:hypothetical protein
MLRQIEPDPIWNQTHLGFVFSLESPRKNQETFEMCRTGSGTGGSFQRNKKLELGPYGCSLEK